MNITALNNYHLNLWHKCSDEQLPLCSYYPSDEKKKREDYLRLKLRKISNIKKYQLRDEHLRNRLFSSAEKASALLLNTKDEDLKIVFSDEFKKSSGEFIEASRDFDINLTKNDIAQAARNLWVINGLQVLFGYPVRMTASAFAYSLLYPYCDNYLDDPSIRKAEKCSFNAALTIRLKGEIISASNRYEEKIFKLISMIEDEFPPDQFPEIFESLSSIHRAQCRSLNLFSKSALTAYEILDMSFEKGGTSVLADGFLVCGKMSDIQIKFVYGLGIYLQIIDDLQDLNEDSEAELSTIFSHYAGLGELDHLTNQTLNFGLEVVKDTNHFQNGDSFRNLISASTNLLIIEAACLSQKAYSRSYIKNLEHFSPFHFSFIKKYRKKYSSIRIPFDEMLRAVPLSE